MAQIKVTATSFMKNKNLMSLFSREFSKDHQLSFADKDLEGEQLHSFLKNADYAIIGKEKIDSTLLDVCPRLKGLSKYGVGMDNIDQKACREHNVKLRFKAGVNKDAVAEITIGMMISLLRNVALSDRSMHKGEWLKNGGTQLTGKTVFIIGCGHIGSKVSRLLKAFSCRILLNDIKNISSLAKELDAKVVSLEEGLKEADVVTLHTPLTPQTLGLINQKTLNLMKSQSFIINTSRGGVIKEEDLIKTLELKGIAGAALDVYEKEPLVNEKLYKLENFLGTAHIAGNAKEAVLAMGEAAIDGIREFTKE